MRLNIQTKLIIALAGLTAIILTGLLLTITRTLTDRIESKIIADFQNTQRIFTEQQRLIYDRLVESCYLIGENSTFKANVQLQDPPSVYFSVLEFGQFAKVDLFIVTDRDGNVLARLRDPESFGDDISDRATVFNALNGVEPDTTIEWPELWGIGANLYQVVTLPVYAFDSIIGSLSLGARFTSVEARNLKGESNIDISFFYNDRLIGASFPNIATSGVQRAVRDYQSVVDSVLTYHIPSPTLRINIKGVEHFAFFSPLGIGERAYYLATVPVSTELSILHAIQQNILITAAIFLLITFLLAYLLGKNFSRPVLRLVQGMNEVKAGNLDVNVEPKTKDEIGLLTQTFNEMIGGLRERLHLMKYVGAHTLDMVKKSAGREVALGGMRQELTVLFSDVRGFTQYSESRSPEEVVNMLNRYLGFQAEIVDRFGGSVDKFVGDEMFALFIGEQSTERALNCALEIQKRVAEEHKTDPAPIHVGIGINHGPVILGNMGAEARMDYTAIGATVNLGARLCSSARAGQILIPKSILDSLDVNVNVNNILLMNFKGISQPIKIAEVSGE